MGEEKGIHTIKEWSKSNPIICRMEEVAKSYKHTFRRSTKSLTLSGTLNYDS